MKAICRSVAGGLCVAVHTLTLPGCSTDNFDLCARGAESTLSLPAPSYDGIEPQLTLSYHRSQADGWMGVGWTLDLSRIERRASSGKGAPRYDATDSYLLDGLELAACTSGSPSSGCAQGGTHWSRSDGTLYVAHDPAD